MSSVSPTRSPNWKWYVCGVLLLATMLNYMDRQTLANTITDISKELGLNNKQYGQLEFGFGMAFATGGILVGFLVDKISVRLMYPLVLIGWSSAGIATAYAQQIGELLLQAGIGDSAAPGYTGLLVCRIALGLFEAGQWPCAGYLAASAVGRGSAAGKQLIAKRCGARRHDHADHRAANGDRSAGHLATAVYDHRHSGHAVGHPLVDDDRQT